jgi:hypothetical protein
MKTISESLISNFKNGEKLNKIPTINQTLDILLCKRYDLSNKKELSEEELKLKQFLNEQINFLQNEKIKLGGRTFLKDSFFSSMLNDLSFINI